MVDEVYMTAQELAELMKVKRQQIYLLANRGQVPCVKFGGQWRFPMKMVEKWLEKQVAKSMR